MNRDPVEWNLDFPHCYKCYCQPIGRNSSFIVLKCHHIYCDTCQSLCAGNQSPDLMFCFVCCKPAKYEPITQLLMFQHKWVIPHGLKSIADKQKSIANQCDIKSDQIKDGTSKMEGQSSGSMSRKRYTELIRMANGKSNQMSCNSTAGQAGQAELRKLPELRTTSSFQSASQLYRNVSQGHMRQNFVDPN